MTSEITQQPWKTLPLIAALLKRKQVTVEHFQPLAIRLNNLSCTAEQRAEFKLMFDCQTLPPSFLFNVGYRHLGQLLAQVKFPSKLMGLIHLSSDYFIHGRIDWHESFDLTLAMKSCTPTEKGFIYQIDIELIQSGEKRLCCVNKILDKDKTYKGKKASAQKEVTPSEGIANQRLTTKLARRYAKMSGDYNPIHLFALSAKLLGMKSAVMHGMYNLHWSLANLTQTADAQQISAQFNRPCFLPRDVELVEIQDNEYGLFSNNQQDRHLFICLIS